MKKLVSCSSMVCFFQHWRIKCLWIILFSCLTYWLAAQYQLHLLFEENGKWGCLAKNDSTVIIPAQYDFAFYFNSSTKEAVVVKDGKWGMIDTTNAVVVPFDYDMLDHFDFQNNAVFCKDNRWGKLSRDLEMTYYPLEDLKHRFRQSYRKSFKSICFSNKCGVVNKRGHILIPFWYTMRLDFLNGRAIAHRNNRYGLIDKENQIVLPFQYRSMNYFPGTESFVAEDDQGRWGTLLVNGSSVVPFDYEFLWASYYHLGLLIAQKNGKYGLIDTLGNTVLAFQYDHLKDAPQLIAALDNKWGLIDVVGKVLLPFGTDKIEIKRHSQVIYEAWYNGRCGLFDTSGRELLPVDFSKITHIKEFYMVETEEGKGLYNKRFERVLAPQYERFQIFKASHPTPSFPYIGSRLHQKQLVYIQALKDGRQIVHNQVGEALFDIDGANTIKGVYHFYNPDRTIFTVVDENNNWGLIDEHGNTLLEPKYDRIRIWQSPYIQVIENDKYGIGDSFGNILLEPEHDYVQYDRIARKGQFYGLLKDDFSGWELPQTFSFIGKAFQSHLIIKKEGRFGVVDARFPNEALADPLIPFEYDSIFSLPPVFALLSGSKWGIADRNGKVVLPPECDEVKRNHDHVICRKGDKWSQLIPPYLDQQLRHSEYRFDEIKKHQVRIGNKWGMLDKMGVEVIPIQCDTIYYKDSHYLPCIGDKCSAYNFHHHRQSGFLYDSIGQITDTLFEAFIDGKAGIFDYDDRVRIAPRYKNGVQWYQPNYIIVHSEDGQVGLIDSTERVILPARFDYIQKIVDFPYLLASKDRQNGVVDHHGNWIVPLSYERIELSKGRWQATLSI